MPKSKKKKAQYKDFQKVKLKVGKKLPKGQNETTTAFKTRNVLIRDQIKEKSQQPTTRRKLNIIDLLSQCHHYNTSIRHDAVVGLKELLASNPDLIHTHLSRLLERVSELFMDKERNVRVVLQKLTRFLFARIPPDHITPFFPVISAHLCCAMTHIFEDIQQDSLKMVDLCLEYYPKLVTSSSSKLLPNFIEQISRQNRAASQTDVVKRALTDNPNSQISSQTWRIRVLDRLYKFLQAVHEQRQNTEDDNETVTEVSWSDNMDGYLPLGSSSVNLHPFSGWTCRCQRDMDQSTSSLEGEQLKNFMTTLIPLLLECWIEAGPSVLATSLPDNMLKPDELSTLSSVLGVLRLLLVFVEQNSDDSNTVSVEWARDRYLKDFVHYFMPFFPFVAHDRQKKEKAKDTEVSVISLNLAVCEVMSSFMINEKSGSAADTWTQKVVTYITGQLRDGQLSTQQLQILIRVTQKLVSTSLAEDVIENMLDAAQQLYRKRHPLSADTRVLLQFFADILFRTDIHLDKSRSGALSSWMKSLPNVLIQVCGQNQNVASFLLTILNKAVFGGHTGVVDAFTAALPSLLDPANGACKSLIPSLQRKLIEILYCIPRIEKKHFDILVKLCNGCVLYRDNVEYMLQILHHRYLKEFNGSADVRWVDTADYLSFLLSICLETSEEELGAYKKEKVSTEQDFFIHSILEIETPPGDYECSKCKRQVVVQILQQFPNQDQLWTVLANYLQTFLNKFRHLPLHTCCAVLLLVTGLSPQNHEAINSEFQQELVSLLGAMAIFTAGLRIGDAESNQKHLSTDTFRTICDCLRKSPPLLPKLTDVVLQKLSATTNIEHMRNVIQALTSFLSEHELGDAVRRSFVTLTNIVKTIEEKFEEQTDQQWWADYKYSLSLVRH